MASQEMIDRFLADPEQKLPPKQKSPRKQPTRSRRPRAISPARREELEAWGFIRRCMLLAQLRTDGHYSCMSCGLKTSKAAHLDLDHLIPAGNGGAWDPENAELKCNRLSRNGSKACHVTKHGEPKWSEVAS